MHTGTTAARQLWRRASEQGLQSLWEVGSHLDTREPSSRDAMDYQETCPKVTNRTEARIIASEAHSHSKIEIRRTCTVVSPRSASRQPQRRARGHYRAGPEVSWDLTHDQSVRPTTGATTAAKRPPITPVIDLEGTL